MDGRFFPVAVVFGVDWVVLDDAVGWEISFFGAIGDVVWLVVFVVWTFSAAGFADEMRTEGVAALQ